MNVMRRLLAGTIDSFLVDCKPIELASDKWLFKFEQTILTRTPFGLAKLLLSQCATCYPDLDCLESVKFPGMEDLPIPIYFGIGDMVFSVEWCPAHLGLVVQYHSTCNQLDMARVHNLAELLNSLAAGGYGHSEVCRAFMISNFLSIYNYFQKHNTHVYISLTSSSCGGHGTPYDAYINIYGSMFHKREIMAMMEGLKVIGYRSNKKYEFSDPTLDQQTEGHLFSVNLRIKAKRLFPEAKEMKDVFNRTNLKRYYTK